MKPRILIIDTYYPEVVKALPVDPALTYEENLKKILSFSFATADFYSRNLRNLGWDAVDVIANHTGLLEKYWHENRMFDSAILDHQIKSFDPEVVFFQDLSLVRDATLHLEGRIRAGQLSCPWPGDEIVSRFDILYTSFPHYIPRIEALGVRAVYNPLAFEPSVVWRLGAERPDEWRFRDIPNGVTYEWVKPRIHDVVFIGGVGNPSHWKYGMEVLETVAREIPTFKWWGYGYDTLPADSALRRCYQGEAWGLQMYEILLQSKICLNRHGEVAEGYANNMRMFEATGCGAMLLTEQKQNLQDLFTDDEAFGYADSVWAVAMIRQFLANDNEREAMAKAGQQRTLRDHTYQQRMKTVSETLKGMLCPA